MSESTPENGGVQPNQGGGESGQGNGGGGENSEPTTTRDDANDLGVPMLPGSPDEPVGPEDALGKGPKRGDYRERLGGSAYQPHAGGEPQKPNADEIGDESGKKGGVETA